MPHSTLHHPVLRQMGAETGASLIELLVGIALGLMVVTAALGTLVMSRMTAQSVTDQLELQQQANNAMRIMTSHLREANSRELEDAGNGAVVFSVLPNYVGSNIYVQGFPRDAQGNDDFGVAYADTSVPSVPDCLGNGRNASKVPSPVISNRFSVTANQLRCLGVDPTTSPQSLMDQVQRLRVLYAFQDTVAAPTTVRYFPYSAVPAANWNTQDLVGLEVCLELAAPIRGTDSVGGSFTDCDGVTQQNGQQVHAVVRQAVRIRSITSAL